MRCGWLALAGVESPPHHRVPPPKAPASVHRGALSVRCLRYSGIRRVRGPRPVRARRTVSGSSHGVLQRPPLRRSSSRVSTPGCPGPKVATPPTRSALAVPPSFDGLLHTSLSRFVAPCRRPWGSPGFEPTCNTRMCHEADPPHRRHALRSLSLRHKWSDLTTPLAAPKCGSPCVHDRSCPSRRWPGRSPKRPDWPRPQGCDLCPSPLL